MQMTIEMYQPSTMGKLFQHDSNNVLTLHGSWQAVNHRQHHDEMAPVSQPMNGSKRHLCIAPWQRAFNWATHSHHGLLQMTQFEWSTMARSMPH
jgi:hypothetical protein